MNMSATKMLITADGTKHGYEYIAVEAIDSNITHDRERTNDLKSADILPEGYEFQLPTWQWVLVRSDGIRWRFWCEFKDPKRSFEAVIYNEKTEDLGAPASAGTGRRKCKTQQNHGGGDCSTGKSWPTSGHDGQWISKDWSAGAQLKENRSHWCHKSGGGRACNPSDDMNQIPHGDGGGGKSSDEEELWNKKKSGTNWPWKGEAQPELADKSDNRNCIDASTGT